MSAQIETTADELLTIIGTKEVEITQLRRVIDNQARKIAQLATENIRYAHLARDQHENRITQACADNVGYAAQAVQKQTNGDLANETN